jgi:hypothetical protein
VQFAPLAQLDRQTCCASTTFSNFCWRSKAAPELSSRRRGHSPLLMALGELHGRNLASALMQSRRVHNTTSDRGGEPIQLAAVVVGAAPGLAPSGSGAKIRRWQNQARAAACPRHRSSNANGLCGQNSAASSEICTTFQRDNLRRHF